MSLARGADLLPAPPRAALAMPLPPDPLTAINLDDLLDAIGAAGWARPLLRPWLRPQARRFARVVREFDDRVGRHGLAAGGEWLVRRMAGGLQVTGRERIPARGPLLVLANHPGMTDTVALFAALAARPDLRVIAQDKPFLRALPHVVRQMIFLPEDGAGRTRVLRAGARHLQAGGALLTFPAGAIEPDPLAGGPEAALASLERWSSSFALLARAAPGVRVVPAIVSQVISARAVAHPVLQLRRTRAERERLATALQILWRPYRAQPARVAFGAPCPAALADAEALRNAVLARARALIATPQAWE